MATRLDDLASFILEGNMGTYLNKISTTQNFDVISSFLSQLSDNIASNTSDPQYSGYVTATASMTDPTIQNDISLRPPYAGAINNPSIVTPNVPYTTTVETSLSTSTVVAPDADFNFLMNGDNSPDLHSESSWYSGNMNNSSTSYDTSPSPIDNFPLFDEILPSNAPILSTEAYPMDHLAGLKSNFLFTTNQVPLLHQTIQLNDQPFPPERIIDTPSLTSQNMYSISAQMKAETSPKETKTNRMNIPPRKESVKASIKTVNSDSHAVKKRTSIIPPPRISSQSMSLPSSLPSSSELSSSALIKTENKFEPRVNRSSQKAPLSFQESLKSMEKELASISLTEVIDSSPGHSKSINLDIRAKHHLQLVRKLIKTLNEAQRKGLNSSSSSSSFSTHPISISSSHAFTSSNSSNSSSTSSSISNPNLDSSTQPFVKDLMGYSVNVKVVTAG